MPDFTIKDKGRYFHASYYRGSKDESDTDLADPFQIISSCSEKSAWLEKFEMRSIRRFMVTILLILAPGCSRPSTQYPVIFVPGIGGYFLTSNVVGDDGKIWINLVIVRTLTFNVLDEPPRLQ